MKTISYRVVGNGVDTLDVDKNSVSYLEPMPFEPPKEIRTIKLRKLPAAPGKAGGATDALHAAIMEVVNREGLPYNLAFEKVYQARPDLVSAYQAECSKHRK